MAAPYIGSKHWWGAKPQAAPGTAETTVTTFLSTESVAMNAKPNHIERKTFAGTGRQLASRLGWVKPEQSVASEALASTPQPWYWLLGAVTTSQPAVSTDPTVYLHTITEADTGPVNLTTESDRVFGKAKQADAKLVKAEVSIKVGEIVKEKFDGLALSHVEGATLTSTPTFTTDALVARSVAIKFDGSADTTVESVDFTVETGMESLPTLVQSTYAQVGQPTTVRKKSMTKVTGKLHFIDFPTAKLTQLLAATPFALVVEADGDIISHAYSKFRRWTLPACQYTGGLDNAVSADVVTGDADFAAYYDISTTTQIKVEAQNTVATINT